jgi:hypothetical protein
MALEAISAGLSIGSTVIGSLIAYAESQEEEAQQLETYEDELRYTQETGSDQLKELSASSAYDIKTAAAEGQQVISASKNIAGESGTRNTGTTAATQKQTEVQVSEELARLTAQSDYTQKAAAAEYTFMNEQLEQKIGWLNGDGTTPQTRTPGGGVGGQFHEEEPIVEEDPLDVDNEEKEKVDVSGKAEKTGTEKVNEDKTADEFKGQDNYKDTYDPSSKNGKAEKASTKVGTEKAKETIAPKTAPSIKIETAAAGKVNEDRDPGSAAKNAKTTEKTVKETKEKYVAEKEKAEKAEKVKERAERQSVSRESRF